MLRIVKSVTAGTWYAGNRWIFAAVIGGALAAGSIGGHAAEPATPGAPPAFRR